MARFEVIETIKGRTRVHTTTRRENGAINERDRLVQSVYDKARRHAEGVGGWVVQGPDGRDPNEVGVVWSDGENEYTTSITYRRVGPDPEVKAAEDGLEDALCASLVALNGATL